MNSRLLTLARLSELRACSPAQEMFKKVFGDQVEVSVERFSQLDVIEARFDYDWAVDSLLTEEGVQSYYSEFRQRRDELKKKMECEWYAAIPRDDRERLEATMFAEFYVKYPRLEERPEVLPEPGLEDPEESLDGT